jgi:hypothetical protein
MADFRAMSATICAELRAAFSPKLEDVANEAANHIEFLTAEVARLQAGEADDPAGADRVPLVITRGMLAEVRRESFDAGWDAHDEAIEEQENKTL